MQIQSVQSIGRNNSSFKAKFIKNGNFAKIWEQQDWTKDLDKYAKEFSKYKKNHKLEIIDTSCNKDGEIVKYTIFNHTTGMLASVHNSIFPANEILLDFFNRVFIGRLKYLFDEHNAKREAFNLITVKK